MSKIKSSKQKAWLMIPRRSFLKSMLGLMGSLALPAWAKPGKKIDRSSLREAEFYRPKNKLESFRNKKE